jgi:glycine cleavage system H protein
MKPEELLYTTTHEWAAIEENSDGAKIATIGLSAFALEALTDLVYLELPEEGTTVTAGKPFGEVESVKAVSDLNSPINGTVIEVHSEAADNPGQLNDDPYGEGWLIKVRLSDEACLGNLMDFAAYQKQCESESH